MPKKIDGLSKARALYAEATRALWQDQTWAKNTRKKMSAAHSTPEARADNSARTKKAWADKKARARRIQNMIAGQARRRARERAEA